MYTPLVLPDQPALAAVTLSRRHERSPYDGHDLQLAREGKSAVLLPFTQGAASKFSVKGNVAYVGAPNCAGGVQV